MTRPRDGGLGPLQRLRALAGNEAGGVAIIIAVMLPVLVGSMGLGAEVGWWYLKQRQLQHAADVAAHAGGVRRNAGDGGTGITNASSNIAARSGFASAAGAIEVNWPPAAGAFEGNDSSVEVTLTETHETLLAAIFHQDPVTIRARAVAKINPVAYGCVLALSPTASEAIKVSGSTIVTLDGCDIASNSNAGDSISMAGDGALTTDCGTAVGGIVTTDNLVLAECGAMKEYGPQIADPYAHVEEPAVTGACVSNKATDETLTPSEAHSSGVSAMRFCNGLDLKGTVTFQPGLYIVEGSDLTVNAGAALNGTGVTFFFTDGAGLKLNGNAQVNLSAPATGPYAGLLFFGERTGAAALNQVNGSSGSTFDGAIYFSASAVEYSGNTGSLGGCTQIIGQTVTFTGNSEVSSNCVAAGAKPIITKAIVAIVE